MEKITEVFGYCVSIVTLVGGWFFGRYTRRKNAIGSLQETINELSKQVSEYQTRIIDLQNEVIEVRKENAELKAGQERMTEKMNELQAENAELKRIITTKQ